MIDVGQSAFTPPFTGKRCNIRPCLGSTLANLKLPGLDFLNDDTEAAHSRRGIINAPSPCTSEVPAVDHARAASALSSFLLSAAS
jgi:hypothetical protein